LRAEVFLRKGIEDFGLNGSLQSEDGTGVPC
jgi:hypothetical protein